MFPFGQSLKTAIINPGMFHKPPFSLEVPGVDTIEGETIPRRNAKYIDGLISRPKPNIATLYDILVQSRETFKGKPAMGSRKLIRKHNEEKMQKKVLDGKVKVVNKQWTYFEMGPYQYTSYEEYYQLAMQIGAGFRKLGLLAGDRVHIFAATSMHWLAVSHGAATQSMPIVTSYDTLREVGLETSLVQTNAKAIFVDAHLLSKLAGPLAKAKAVKIVIYNDQQGITEADIDKEVIKLRSLHADLLIMSFDMLVSLGKSKPVAVVPPGPEDLCCIMYTSGTTGTPKGVSLKHRNVVAAIAGLDSIFKDYVSPKDSVLSYLPLAHSFEYAFENACLYWGMRMGYANPRTLTDDSMRNCKGDIKEFKPTILVGVPQIWDTVKKGINEQVAKKSSFTQKIFDYALKAKIWMCERKVPGARLLDRLVFRSIKKSFGGRLRACFNGAGSLAKETRAFISYTIAPLVSGYGLTETVAMGALQDPLEWTDDTAGDIPSCIEIKLVDFPEANYFARNNQGEVWIRGDAVMDGYYENDAETQLAMAPNGWFKTGDIGSWDNNGHLKIVDRKKNLVKNKNGEYIALEKLESVYREARVVENVCVYAAEDQNTILAIVIPLTGVIQQFANTYGDGELQGLSYGTLLHNDIVKKFVLNQLKTTAQKADLAKVEIVSAVILTDEKWTIDNGLVTPAQKLRRRDIYRLFEDETKDIYHPELVKVKR